MREPVSTCLQLLIAVTLIGAAAPGAAQFDPQDEGAEDLSYSRPGAYVGLGGAAAIENFASKEGGHDDSVAIVFRGGYRGSPYLAVELLGEVVTQFEGTDALDNDVHGFAVTLNVKGLLPLGRFEPFAMIGMGLLDIDADRHRDRRDDFAFRSAVGLDFHITRHWAAYAEAMYLLPAGEVSKYKFGTLGAGIVYRF